MSSPPFCCRRRNNVYFLFFIVSIRVVCATHGIVNVDEHSQDSFIILQGIEPLAIHVEAMSRARMQVCAASQYYTEGYYRATATLEYYKSRQNTRTRPVVEIV